MIFGIAHNGHASAARFHFISFRNTFDGVVGALGLKVGPDFTDDRAHVVLGKNHYRIHSGEGGENFRTLFRGDQWTPRAFECANRVVGIHGHYQLPAEFPSGVQITDVSDVEQVKAAIGESNARPGPPPFGDTFSKLFAAENLGMDGCPQF